MLALDLDQTLYLALNHVQWRVTKYNVYLENTPSHPFNVRKWVLGTFPMAFSQVRLPKWQLSKKVQFPKRHFPKG